MKRGWALSTVRPEGLPEAPSPLQCALPVRQPGHFYSDGDCTVDLQSGVLSDGSVRFRPVRAEERGRRASGSRSGLPPRLAARQPRSARIQPNTEP